MLIMETTTTKTPENNRDKLQYTPLARRLGEIARKGVATSVVTGSVIAAGFAANHIANGGSSEHEDARSPEIHSASASLSVEKSATFADGEGGTAVAQRLLQDGIEDALLGLQPGREFSPEEAATIAAELPKLEQAQELFEAANKDGILPDAGDELYAKMFVTADSDGTVTYEVVEAALKDHDNN